jgi:hypothetical protein
MYVVIFSCKCLSGQFHSATSAAYLAASSEISWLARDGLGF